MGDPNLVEAALAELGRSPSGKQVKKGYYMLTPRPDFDRSRSPATYELVQAYYPNFCEPHIYADRNIY